MGFTIYTNQESNNVTITSIDVESAAWAAGVGEDDTIIGINDIRVEGCSLEFIRNVLIHSRNRLDMILSYSLISPSKSSSSDLSAAISGLSIESGPGMAVDSQNDDEEDDEHEYRNYDEEIDESSSGDNDVINLSETSNSPPTLQ